MKYKLSLKFTCPKCDNKSYLSKDRLKQIKWHHYTKCPVCKTDFDTDLINKYISKINKGGN